RDDARGVEETLRRLSTGSKDSETRISRHWNGSSSGTASRRSPSSRKLSCGRSNSVSADPHAGRARSQATSATAESRYPRDQRRSSPTKGIGGLTRSNNLSTVGRVGVLAVQGNFREHAAMLRRLGAEV